MILNLDGKGKMNNSKKIINVSIDIIKDTEGDNWIGTKLENLCEEG